MIGGFLSILEIKLFQKIRVLCAVLFFKLVLGENNPFQLKCKQAKLINQHMLSEQ
jgi:hypothetical protein